MEDNFENLGDDVDYSTELVTYRQFISMANKKLLKSVFNLLLPRISKKGVVVLLVYILVSLLW